MRWFMFLSSLVEVTAMWVIGWAFLIKSLCNGFDEGRVFAACALFAVVLANLAVTTYRHG